MTHSKEPPQPVIFCLVSPSLKQELCYKNHASIILVGWNDLGSSIRLDLVDQRRDSMPGKLQYREMGSTTGTANVKI